MMTYLKTINLNSFEISHAAIQLIIGNLTIQNSTSFHNQKVIFRSFLSSINMVDSFLANITIQQSVMEIVSSTIIFKNIMIENMRNTYNKTFILITSESVFNASMIDYLNSESTLFSIQSSQAQILNLNYININGGQELITVYSSNYIYLSNINLINTSTTSNYMIKIGLSKNITIENIIIQNSYYPLFKIDKSEVTNIHSAQISNNQEPFKITSSKITLLSNSSFKMNGFIFKVAGGAINLFNSEIEILNSSFTENKAKAGGAISFLCNSMLK